MFFAAHGGGILSFLNLGLNFGGRKVATHYVGRVIGFARGVFL
jgi:hypothetical protein